MTTNSPNPVDGDVQALIADCQAEIEDLKRSIDRCDAIGTADYLYHLQSKLKRQYAALAALTAEPVDRIVDDGCSQRIGCVQVSDKLNCTWPLGTQFYTTPPAQLLRPVELPPLIMIGYTQDEMTVMCNVRNLDVEAIRKAGYEVKK